MGTRLRREDSRQSFFIHKQKARRRCFLLDHPKTSPVSPNDCIAANQRQLASLCQTPIPSCYRRTLGSLFLLPFGCVEAPSSPSGCRCLRQESGAGLASRSPSGWKETDSAVLYDVLRLPTSPPRDPAVHSPLSLVSVWSLPFAASRPHPPFIRVQALPRCQVPVSSFPALAGTLIYYRIRIALSLVLDGTRRHIFDDIAESDRVPIHHLNAKRRGPGANAPCAAFSSFHSLELAPLPAPGPPHRAP